jgi:hypothetical protein
LNTKLSFRLHDEVDDFGFLVIAQRAIR